MKESKSRFVRVSCGRCGNKQVVFGKSSTRVKCENCNKLLVRVGGGKVKIKSKVQEVFR